jgi:phosphatidylinositol alpha-1,6-mannosyltransferase
MERLNYHAFLGLQRQYVVALCGPEGASQIGLEELPIAEFPVKPVSHFLWRIQLGALALAFRFRPDVVYSGSGVTAPAALMAAASVRARTVCFLHGLDIVADHALYQRFFLPAIRRVDRILVNSRNTADLARAVGIEDHRICVVNPGVSIPEWSAKEVSGQRFRECYGLENRPILLAVGRLTQRKGLIEFIQYALSEIRRQIPNMVFVIIGAEPEGALKHCGGILSEIRTVVQRLGLDECVRMLGVVDDHHLSEAYFAANALVFPVLDMPGDVEGFGMVAIEAAAHGLPTVGFAVGGVPDAVSEGVTGWLVSSGDYPAMTACLINLLSQDSDREWTESCRAHACQFSWAMFEKRLMDAVEK